jgi:hypothetical protein
VGFAWVLVGLGYNALGMDFVWGFLGFDGLWEQLSEPPKPVWLWNEVSKAKSTRWNWVCETSFHWCLFDTFQGEAIHIISLELNLIICLV